MVGHVDPGHPLMAISKRATKTNAGEFGERRQRPAVWPEDDSGTERDAATGRSRRIEERGFPSQADFG